MKIKWYSLLIYAVLLLSGCGFADDFYNYPKWSDTVNQEKDRLKEQIADSQLLRKLELKYPKKLDETDRMD